MKRSIASLLVLGLLTNCTGVCNGAQGGKWSPDGSKIVYSVADNPIRPDSNATDEGLWIMHADGSHPVQFTKPPAPYEYC